MIHPYRRIAGMLLLALLLALTFFAGIAVGITFAAPRPSPVIPTVSASLPDESDQARTGAPQLPEATTGTPSPTAVEQQPSTVESVSGTASWYDDGSGLYGAVNSWRWGDTPYTAQVCGYDGGKTNCVLVTVRDFCQCHVGTADERVIDLSPEAFRSLAPLQLGLVRVTVDWPL